jgi:hypothetical protein
MQEIVQAIPLLVLLFGPPSRLNVHWMPWMAFPCWDVASTGISWAWKLGYPPGIGSGGCGQRGGHGEENLTHET